MTHPHQLFDFTDKVLLVTGGSGGIGRGICVRFAEAGASVAFSYKQNQAGAKQTVEMIEGLGKTAVYSQADVTQQDQVVQMVAKVMGEYGRIDILINNTGTYPLDAFTTMSLEAWQAVMDTNLTSTFLCTQAVANQMIQQGQGGAIVNIASIEGTNPAPMHSHYNAAKAGVIMLTRSTANELGQYNIRVNTVSPGLIWREGIEDAWPEGVERWQNAAPLTRLGKPDDIANACLFLTSPAARWITGTNLTVDGGVMTNQIF
ncbi:MAG: glucose 1-dehydrogenase [Chloroflexota bacterium]